MRRFRLMQVFLLLALSSAGLASAEIQCPPSPEQASKDSKVSVQLAVGRLGPLKAGDFSTDVQRTTKDLLEKLPKADRVFLEQMMFAAFCSSIRDDRILSNAEKSRALRGYARDVRKEISKGEINPRTKASVPKPSLGTKKTSKHPSATDSGGLTDSTANSDPTHNTGQKTTGDQSPAIQSGRDVNIQYGESK